MRTNMRELPIHQGNNHQTQWAKVIDHTRCIGCHACTTACKSENEVPLAVPRTYVKHVDFDKSICIGCKACMAACPYDAIFINPEDHSAEKCNFCAHRIDMGLEPACVVVCPVEAILDRKSTRLNSSHIPL